MAPIGRADGRLFNILQVSQEKSRPVNVKEALFNSPL